MSLELLKIEEKDLKQFKLDMQQAFKMGAIEDGGFDESEADVLPESDIDKSLSEKGAIGYKAMLDGKMVGGCIIVLDQDKREGNLHFLYVKHGIQGKGIGKFIWFEIEKLHPEIKVWATCTPYFEKRNIHFYVNVCKFHIVEFFNEHHKDPREPDEAYEHEHDENAPEGYFDGMFEFRKEMT